MNEFTRKFECEEYTVYARPNSCFFCTQCTDIFYDWDGPYLWLCDINADTHDGMMGKCKHFNDDGNGESECLILIFTNR